MRRRYPLVLLLALLALPAPARAQALPIDALTPPLPTAGERRAADIASWATVIAAQALDVRAAWNAPHRTRALILDGVRDAVTLGAVEGLKVLVHRTRPCAPTCGVDNPRASFPSGHTAFTFVAVRGTVGVSIGIGTASLRVLADKHYLTDVLAGAGIGVLTSRIR